MHTVRSKKEIAAMRWLVKCECGHEFKTKAFKPYCSECNKKTKIEWLEQL